MRHKRPKMPAPLRRLVYERDGYACRSCGWSPGRPDHYDGKHPISVVLRVERRVVWAKYSFNGGEDQYIYRDFEVTKALEVDHIVPLIAGGPFAEISNLQALCSVCNNRKGTKV